MDILGMVAIFIMGAIAFNFGNNNRSIVSIIFGILLGLIAITYISITYIFCRIFSLGMR